MTGAQYLKLSFHFSEECTRAKNRQCTCIPKKCSKGGVFSNRLRRCACKRGYWGDACEYPCACKNTNNFCRLLPKSYCSRPSFYNWLRRNCSETCPKVCEIVKPPPRFNC
ncbi:hypothetical protein LSAT2_005862 [Lamellibrachia satsuma]|nr:hypothetical protein LSAT2_005862 [Lamellibrachia satsuma]